MPIPLIVAGGAALLGAAFGVGRYSERRSELKEKIIELQEMIERLESLISKQNDTIRNLKAENKSLNALHFMEKRKLFGRTKGLIIFQYALREYLEFVRLEADGQISVNDSEHTLAIFWTVCFMDRKS
jgi:chromosome segregation ATPase